MFITFILLVTTSLPASAHGEPPFIKVNGKQTIQNAVYAGSSLFKVPSEGTQEDYLVNEKLTFGADTNLLPVDPSIITQSEFTWDFGDGTKAHPLNSTHTYQKAGSYIVILSVKDPNYNTDVELESVQINILPTKDYSTPKVIIKVNGKKITDPLKEPVVVTKNSTLEFDASNSTGNIKSYKWDFGDGSALETAKKVKHTFKFNTPYTYSIFPLLRIEDDKGLFNDGFVQLSSSDNSQTGSTKTKETDSKTSSNSFLILVLAGLLIISGFGYFGFKKFSKKKAAP